MGKYKAPTIRNTLPPILPSPVSLSFILFASFSHRVYRAISRLLPTREAAEKTLAVYVGPDEQKQVWSRTQTRGRSAGPYLISSTALTWRLHPLDAFVIILEKTRVEYSIRRDINIAQIPLARYSIL